MFSKYDLTCRTHAEGSAGRRRRRGALSRLRRASLWTVAIGLIGLGPAGLGGCGSFNPAFVSLVDPVGDLGFSTLDNAPGHVVITVANNAGIDERLLNYLASELNLSDAELQAARPRMRMRVLVAFTDGSVQTIEFVTGSGDLVEPGFSGVSDPDLNQNDLNNVGVLCDVAAVTLEPGSAIEVFVPVELTAFELVETTNAAGVVTNEFQERDSIPPGFIVLQTDDVDDDGNVVLQRNIGVRDVPSPVANVLCGSVVVIEVNGELSVPFLETRDFPSFDRDAEQVEAGIGGRYEFRVGVQ